MNLSSKVRALLVDAGHTLSHDTELVYQDVCKFIELAVCKFGASHAQAAAGLAVPAVLPKELQTALDNAGANIKEDVQGETSKLEDAAKTDVNAIEQKVDSVVDAAKKDLSFNVTE